MKKTKQSGFTLIELVIALTVIGVLMPIVYQHWQIGYIAEQQSHAADQLRQVNDASDAYIKGTSIRCFLQQPLLLDLKSQSISSSMTAYFQRAFATVTYGDSL